MLFCPERPTKADIGSTDFSLMINLLVAGLPAAAFMAVVVYDTGRVSGAAAPGADELQRQGLRLGISPSESPYI